MYLRLALTALFGLLALTAVGCSQCGPGEKPAAPPDAGGAPPQAVAPVEETGPIAVVNGDEVSRAEFDEMYDKMTRVYTRRNKPVPENVARRHKQNIVNRLVEKKLIEQAVAKAGVVVTPEEMDEGLTKYKEMFRTEENFERYLQSSNTTLDKVKENIRFNKALDKLLTKDGPITVTEDQMKEYYEQNKSRYKVEETVRAAHILIRLGKDATDEEKAAALTKANGIYKEAKNPKADFNQLAIKHSEGPTGPKGGDLGLFTRGRMAPEFEAVAFAMKPGEISKPVLTQFGYHIIKVFEKKPAGQKAFEEVRESIQKLLESRDMRKRKSDMLRGLKASATIVNNLKLPPLATPVEAGEPSALPEGVKLVPTGPTGEPTPPPAEVPAPAAAPAPATPAPAPAP